MSLLTIALVELRTQHDDDPAIYFVTGDYDGGSFEGTVTFTLDQHSTAAIEDRITLIKTSLEPDLDPSATSVLCRVVHCIRHGQSLRLPYLIDLNQRLPAELGVPER